MSSKKAQPKKKKRAKGGGRKKGEPTRTKTFRINDANLTKAEKKYPRILNKMANDWIETLI